MNFLEICLQVDVRFTSQAKPLSFLMCFSMTPIRWSGSQVDWNRAARLSNSIRCSCTLRWKYWPSKLPPSSWDASIRYLESSSEMILLTPSPVLLLTIGCPKYTIEINTTEPGTTVATVVNCLVLWTEVPLSACTLIGVRNPGTQEVHSSASDFCGNRRLKAVI